MMSSWSQNVNQLHHKAHMYFFFLARIFQRRTMLYYIVAQVPYLTVVATLSSAVLGVLGAYVILLFITGNILNPYFVLTHCSSQEPMK
jgi:hypothetical protein